MIDTEVKLTLYCDDKELKSWIYSNNDITESGAMGCIEEGHSYYMVYSAKNINSLGKILDEVVRKSDVITY